MELKVDNAKYWAECIGVVSNLVNEGLLKADKDGLSLKAMDNTNISMVSFLMPNKVFSKYAIENEESFGINFDNLTKMLSRIREGESLVIKGKEDAITFEFHKEKSKRRMKSKLIEIKDKDVKEPKITSTATLRIKAKDLSDVIKDVAMVSPYMSLELDKEKQRIYAKGDMGEIDEDFICDSSIEKEVKVGFNLEFVQDMIRGCPSENEIEIQVASGSPMRLSYNIGDTKVAYYLAPYMED
ncbi:MAG: hypothetical protein ACYCS1_05125 [Gammaproteobacteria bacterium]